LKLPPQTFSRTILILTVLVSLITAAVFYIQRRFQPASASSEVKPEPPGDPNGPHIELTPDGQVARIQHKDASGRSPLELVHTPQGVITIRRTFTSTGVLVKEEASLNGQPVPVPQR
jgi:hypothetical protein